MAQELEHRHDQVRGVKVFSIAGAPTGAPSRGSSTVSNVVMIHGLAVSNRYLAPSLQQLATDHRVLVPDLPGVGRSTTARHRLSMADLADGLIDWMDVVGVQRATVIGHSLGCQLAAMLAARYPDRVTAVVLTSPARDPEQQSLWRQAWQLLRDAPRERVSMVVIAVLDYTRVGMLRMLRAIRSARHSDAMASLRRIQQPTLVVRGGRDPLVSERWAEALTRELPAGSLVTLPGAPHGVPYSAVEPFVAAVRDFLAMVEDPRPR